MKDGIVILEWRPVERGTLLGFAKIQIPAWRVTIAGVALHRKDGRAWAQLPARLMLDANRELEREPDGKLRYAKILWFDDRETADRFSAAVVEAIDRFTAASDRVERGAF
jgi:hypothetical protein